MTSIHIFRVLDCDLSALAIRGLRPNRLRQTRTRPKSGLVTFNGDEISESIVDDAEHDILLYLLIPISLYSKDYDHSLILISNIVFQATSKHRYWQEANLMSRGTSPIHTG